MFNGTVLQQAVRTKAKLVSRSTYSLLRDHLEFFASFLSTGTFHSNSVIVKAYTTGAIRPKVRQETVDRAMFSLLVFEKNENRILPLTAQYSSNVLHVSPVSSKHF